MFRKIIIAAAAATAGLTALPATASADHGNRDGYYDNRGYDRGSYDRRDYDRRYYDRRGAYSRGYRTQGYRTQGYGNYYGNSYGYRDGRGYRNCGSGTTGAIIGGAAGALLGREVSRSGGRGYYRRGGSGTTGAIIGGAVGALIGREVGRSC
jgi:hypothetical protein